MVVAYSMIFCFMPKMVAIMVALRPVTGGGGGRECRALGFLVGIFEDSLPRSSMVLGGSVLLG